MIERIDDMPPGTVGLRAAGKLSKDDYVEVLEPALREGIASGELRSPLRPHRLRRARARCRARGLENRVAAWVREHSAWKRFGLVTDVEWVPKAMQMFTWLTPGEVMVAGLAQEEEEEEAKRWVAA